jgi:amidohydrolase
MFDINKEAKASFAELVKLRRYLHQHPESSTHEKETARFVAKTLRGYGIAVKERVGGYGVVGLVRGAQAGKCIALRADMDALRIQEENNVPFRSKNNGLMHACGHDAHTAMLLVTGRILQKNRHLLKGTVKLLFQPSEECNPGGALAMIREGVLQNPRVDAILALHVFPEITSGRIGVRNGISMAQADEFRITVIGKSGHGSQPDVTIDPIVTAAAIVQALQTIVSRKMSPFEPAVVSIGRIQGGHAWNIIPDQVVLAGTARSLKPVITKRIKRELFRIVRRTAAAFGARTEIVYQSGFPPVVNNIAICDLLRSSVRTLYGNKALVEIQRPSMGGEDFAYYLKKVTGAMFYLGVRPKQYFPLHNSRFTLDEQALPKGVGTFVRAVMNYLQV